MKQSTKLLSLVLALVMAFSCMSVIGNAATIVPLDKNNIAYSTVDDAVLTPEQVANLICNMLDEMLEDANIMNEEYVGVTLNLTSVNGVIDTLYDVSSSGLASLLGDLKDFEQGPLTSRADGGSLNGKFLQRVDGDLNCLIGVVKWLQTNRGVISKLVYGIDNGSGSLDPGTIGGVILDIAKLDLSDINNLLANLDKMVYEMVYDMLMPGSYRPENDYGNESYPFAEDITARDGDYAVLPTDANTIDTMLNRAVAGLLKYPQDYEYKDLDNDPKTDDVKVWDKDAVVFPTIGKNDSYDIGTVISYFNLFGKGGDFDGDGAADANSFFQLLDKLAPFGIYDLGIPALNNNLKKTLMEAVDVEFNEIKSAEVPSEVMTVFNNEAAYVTYIGYDCLEQGNDGIWYYTTLTHKPVLDDSGKPVTDADGNEVTERVRSYYRANAGGANSFYSMINWNWEFYAPVPLSGDTTSDSLNELNYDALIKDYGSIIESLNHILYVVYKTALTTDVQKAYKAMVGVDWEDGPTSTKLNSNLTNLIKYLIAEHADSIFGKDSAYVAWTYEDLKALDLIDLIAIIGPSFFKDVMPQLVIPQNEDGTYAFGDSDQLLKFAAIVIREFASEVSPTTNYDAYIFEGGSVTSANGRFFNSSNKADDWYNIILNMGLDIGYTYLNNLTSFNTATPAVAITEARWMGMLDAAITWAVNYVGDGSTSVISGLDPNTVASKGDAFGKISYVLNTLLPLGFINGCTTSTYDFDVATLFAKVKSFFTTVDFTLLFGLFGRNKSEDAYNMLDDENFGTALLKLIDRVLNLVLGSGTNLITSVTTNSLDTLLNQANLQTVVQTLLNSLGNIVTPLLNNGLPVLATFIGDWGGEQEIGTPSISVDTSATVAAGTTSHSSTLNFSNGSVGVWRGYMSGNTRMQDEQYKYIVTGIKAYNIDGTESSNMTFGALTGNKVDYGSSEAFSMTMNNIPVDGIVQRIEVSYKVTDEDGNTLGGDDAVYTVNAYCVYDQGSGMSESSTQDNGGGGTYTLQYNTNMIYDATGTDYDSLVSSITGRVAYTITCSYSWRGNKHYANIASMTPSYGISMQTENVETKNSAVDKSFYFTLSSADDLKAGIEATKAGLVLVNPVAKYDILKGSTSMGTATMAPAIYFYDGQGLGWLKSLVYSEFVAMRTAENYKTSGTVYAGDILSTSYNYLTEEFDDISNFSDKGVDPDSGSNKEVTMIDCNKAYNNYINALNAAARAAYAVEFDGNQQFNYRELYANLQVAINDIKYCGKTAEDYAVGGGNQIGSAIDALEAQLDEVEATYSDTKDYTDYMMYRWNRYNDVRDEAKYFINLKASTERTESDLTKYFPYNWMAPSDLETLVADDKYEAYILALLEDYSADEIKANRASLDAAKTEYNLVDALGVAQASNLLSRIPGRLIERNNGTKDIRYLTAEIESAKNMIGTNNGTEQNPTKYTWRSWKRYIEAYNTALEVQAAPTQMHAFDSKYELLCARNELVLLEDAADYSELEALIAQATQAVANASLYNNTAKEIGLVLAQLGYSVDGTDLFPGSALYYNEEPYSKDEQDVIDDAADRLKEALSKLKFNGLNFTGAPVATETIVEGNAEAGIEAVTASVARIAALQDAEAVKALFKATATGASAVELTVSNDDVYTVNTALNNYTGTNATVTFYTEVGGIKVPVATVKVVVEADVNGDGVLDVLDGALTELVSNGHAELEGCYKIAANLDTASSDIVATDYSLVVNKIVAA